MLKYKKVLWLCPKIFAGGIESLQKKYLKALGMEDYPIYNRCLTQNALKKIGKTKYTWDQSKYKEFIKNLDKINPDFIVCNDKAALGLLTQQYISLSLTRGSIYRYKETPILVIDDLRKTKSTTIGSWVLKQDLQKLKRWIDGTQKPQPKFSYTVCKSKQDLIDLKNDAENSILIGTDIETSGGGNRVIITCSGYSCVKKDGSIKTYVVPFVDTTNSDGCYWRTYEEELFAYKTIREVHSNSVPKTLQNGSYDSAHVISYNIPYNNYILDTLHIFHSIYAESPKKIDFISSLCLDFYRYWKDESKEDGKDDAQKTKIPQTSEGLRNYWRYNALDCYYTVVDTLFLIQVINSPQLSWALTNYIKEFKLQTGPCLAGSMRGIKCNREIQKTLNYRLLKQSQQADADLKIAVGDPNFNPSSPKQVANLIYGILKADEIPRKGKSTGEPVLKLIQTQHPFIDKMINRIWDVKKPANNAAKYGQLELMNERFMFKLSQAGTETGRQASKQSDFWRGTNVQNMPEPIRILLEADEDYILFDFDYAQSDAYFTAFESQDQKFISTMLSPKDTHCIHAEHFFKIPYKKLIEAKRNHEKWCTHKVTGIRSITKKAVYGSNYMMTGYTLFINMGLESTIAAAKHLGYEDASSWNFQQYTYLCQKLIEAYFEMYPGIPAWLTEEISQCINNNNLYTCYGGFTRLFFADLRNDKAAQRELAAFYGQGGTAGNVNAFLEDFYYGPNRKNSTRNTSSLDNFNISNPPVDHITDSSDIMFLFQVHDSVVGQVHKTKLHLLKQLKIQMERTCEIKGHKFVVPVEGSVGIGWGERMIDWNENITLDDIYKHEKEWWIKWRNQ